jgi:hypothetical protein
LKAFLLAYNSVFSPEYVHRVLSSTRAIQTWASPFPNTAIILSNLTVSELAAVLHTHFGEIWFIVVEVNKDNANGWLPAQFWDYVSDPQSTWSKRLFEQLGKTLPPPPSFPPSLESLLSAGKKKP